MRNLIKIISQRNCHQEKKTEDVISKRIQQKRGQNKSAEFPPRKNKGKTISNHPVLKTTGALHAHIPRFLLTRPDRKQELYNQRLHFGRRNKAKQELPRNVSGESGVHAVEMLAFRVGKNGMETKQGSEIIKRHFGKYLPHDK